MIIVVNDQTRTYQKAVGVAVDRVKAGNCIASKAIPAASTLETDPVVSTLIEQKKGGSGTESARYDLTDDVTVTDGDGLTSVDHYEVHVTIVQRPKGSASAEHAGHMLSGLTTKLVENNCAIIKDAFEGVLTV